MPEMIPISSEGVAAVGYDEQAEELHVEFRNGRKYAYTGVPAHIYDDLMAAASRGNFINTVVKQNFPVTPL